MVRTKSDAYIKTSVKASRKTSVLSSDRSCSSPKSSKGDKYSGGNPYCPRPTPEWQKPITNFFTSNGTGSSKDVNHESEGAGSSKGSENVEDIESYASESSH